MKATEQYFPVVLFIMLFKVVLTFEFVGKILHCDYLNKGFSAEFFHGTVCFPVACKIKFRIFVEF